MTGSAPAAHRTHTAHSMRRATTTLLARLHNNLGPLGASSSGATVAAGTTSVLSPVAAAAAAVGSRAASSAAAGPLVGVCVLERLPVSYCVGVAASARIAWRPVCGGRGCGRPTQNRSTRLFFFPFPL